MRAASQRRGSNAVSANWIPLASTTLASPDRIRVVRPETTQRLFTKATMPFTVEQQVSCSGNGCGGTSQSSSAPKSHAALQLHSVVSCRSLTRNAATRHAAVLVSPLVLRYVVSDIETIPDHTSTPACPATLGQVFRYAGQTSRRLPSDSQGFPEESSGIALAQARRAISGIRQHKRVERERLFWRICRALPQ